MSRKRRGGDVFATDVPRIRDWIALDDTDRRIEETRTWDAQQWAREYFRGIGDVEITVASLQDSMLHVRAALLADDAHLWWVAPRMCEMAAEADASMPDWTPAAARPSRAGLVMWASGTGIVSDDGAEARGALWITFPDGGFSLTPIVAGDGAAGMVADWDHSCMWIDPRDGVKIPQITSSRRFADAMWRRLGATWLLAQSPTVGVVHGVKYWRRDPERPFAKPSLPGLITQVTLREVDYGRPEIGGVKRPGQGPTHQFIVRGHWRQQACGPKRAWRRPTYIAPFVKGPAGTPLETKPAVRVWRR